MTYIYEWVGSPTHFFSMMYVPTLFVWLMLLAIDLLRIRWLLASGAYCHGRNAITLGVVVGTITPSTATRGSVLQSVLVGACPVLSQLAIGVYLVISLLTILDRAWDFVFESEFAKRRFFD